MRWIRELLARPKPCELCQLGKQEWQSENTAVAEWKFEGTNSKNRLMICRVCRTFLMDSNLFAGNPVVAHSALVAQDRTNRVAPWLFTNNATWRYIWLRTLASEGELPSDEAELVRAISARAEQSYKAAGYGPNIHKVPRLDADGRVDLGTALRTLVKEHDIPFELVERKYMGYLVALQAAGKSSNWNADIDQMARRKGVFNNKEIQRAHSDLHQAILNRVKLALHMEGCFHSENPDEPDDGGVEPRDEPVTREPPMADIARTQTIPIPGYGSEWAMPHVNLKDAKSDEEYNRLFMTAAGGAAHLLVPIILDRVDGSLPLPLVRGCALDMVLEAVERNLVVSEDTRGYFVAGRSLFETCWTEWESDGDPVATLEAMYKESSETSE